MKNWITVDVDYDSAYGDFPPSDLFGVIKWFAAKVDAIPERSRKDATVEFGVTGLNDDDCRAAITIAYQRWETPEEERKREDDAELARLRAKNAEYQQYLALKAKYEKDS